MEGNENSLTTQELYSPVDSYQNHYKQLHHENTICLFNEMVKKSQIDITANQATCKKIAENDEKTVGNNKAIKWKTIFRNIAAFFLGISTITIIYSGIKLFSAYIIGYLIIRIIVAIIIWVIAFLLFNFIKYCKSFF